MQISVLLIMLLFTALKAEAFQLDLEASLQNRNTDLKENKLTLNKAGIGVKKIIGDDKGDRLYLFFKGEAEDNFIEKNIEQLYAKYKGPMGRWNVTLGRSLVPFGLMTEYDSEWLILKTQEVKTIGFKNDDGIKISGFWGSIDYEFFLSSGKGIDNRGPGDINIAVIKTSYKGGDVEDLKIGFSFLQQEVSDIKKSLAGIDLIKYKGLLISRSEIVIGEEEGKDVLSVFAGIDFSVLPKVDLNAAYNYFDADYDEKSVFLGITYNTPIYGIVLRAGNKYYINDYTGDDKNEIFLQIYKYYSHYF